MTGRVDLKAEQRETEELKQAKKHKGAKGAVHHILSL